MSELVTAKEYHVWFDSIPELEAELPSLIKRQNSDYWANQTRSRRNYSWLGCSGFVQALLYVRDGWPALLTKLMPMVEQLKTGVNLDTVESVVLPARRRKRTRHDYGDTLDMHRVWSGQLDTAWERPVRRVQLTSSQRYASVFVDLSMSCFQTFDDSMWRAAEAFCLIEMLTRMGVNTEVWCGTSNTMSYQGGPVRSWTGVRVKEYTQPMNDERLAVLCSATFHRSWNFGMILAGPWRAAGNYGYPAHSGFVHPLRERVARGERVLRLGNCFDEYAAVNEMKSIIKLLSGEKKEEECE